MPRLHRLEVRVLRSIRQQGLITEGDTVVVAVSGGVDSLALMHILHRLQSRLRCQLHIATLDHGLRGQAGAEDAAFVMAEAARLDLPFVTGRHDTAKFARESRLSIEEAARKLRYQFLARVAHEVGASQIAVAHHADDQAETVLMRVLRGSSLRGLAAMRPRDHVPYSAFDYRLIRPLLGCRRRDIEAYAQERGLQPRRDASNDLRAFRRNVVRLDILPMLREINPRIDQALAQLADNAAADDDYFDEALRPLMGTVISLHPGTRRPYMKAMTPGFVRVDRAGFRALHPALQRRLVVWAYRRLALAHDDEPKGEIGHAHVMACVRAITNGAVGKRVQLPGSLALRIDYDHADIEDEQRVHEERGYLLQDPERSVLVRIPGVTEKAIRGCTLQAQIAAAERDIVKGETSIERALIFLPRSAAVSLRGRRPGDRFAPPGLGGHTQKIKQWMIDRKIPQIVRDRVPLLDVNGAIAAVFWDGRWHVAEGFRAPHEDALGVRFVIES